MHQNLVILITITAAVLFLTIVAFFFFNFNQVRISSNHWFCYMFGSHH